MSEGKQQLLMGVFIAAFLALIFFGPKLDTPVLFGLTLSSLEILFSAGMVSLGIVGSLRFPPTGRDAMLTAVNFLVLSLSLFTVIKGEKVYAMHVIGIATVALSGALGLFLLVRCLIQSTRQGAAT